MCRASSADDYIDSGAIFVIGKVVVERVKSFDWLVVKSRQNISEPISKPMISVEIDLSPRNL
jgi:hypothetical protein